MRACEMQALRNGREPALPSVRRAARALGQERVIARRGTRVGPTCRRRTDARGPALHRVTASSVNRGLYSKRRRRERRAISSKAAPRSAVVPAAEPTRRLAAIVQPPSSDEPGGSLLGDEDAEAGVGTKPPSFVVLDCPFDAASLDAASTGVGVDPPSALAGAAVNSAKGTALAMARRPSSLG